MIRNPDMVMVTAGGKIACRRCKASSVRTKEQCGRPAIKGKEVCQFHGGRSTGPKSKAAKDRLRTLNLKHGEYIAERRLASSSLRFKLRYLEEIAIHIGMFTTKTRGRKPRGWVRLNPNVPLEYERMLRLAGLLN